MSNGASMTPNSYTFNFRAMNRPRVLDYFTVLICMVIIPSAVFHGLLGVDEKTVFSIFAPIVLLGTWMMTGFHTPKTAIFLVLSFATIGAFATLVAQNFSQLLMGVTLSIAFIVGHQLYICLKIPKMLRILTWFTLALQLAGMIGIIYSAAGGQPLLEIQLGYRTTKLYLTTFSFAYIGDFIRPSGIFDEPGAFAMYAIIVTMFNDTLRQNHKLNLVIILLVIFTGSLAGLVLAILYFLTSNSTYIRHKARIRLSAGLLSVYFLMLALFPANPITNTLDTFYSARLVFVDGGLAGDNRSNQISNFFDIVNDDILLYGSKNLPQKYDDMDFSSNPFSITFGYGLIISLPYFSLLGWLIWSTIKNGFRNSYTSIGLIFLLLQRPYIYHMSWSILIASAVWLLYIDPRERWYWKKLGMNQLPKLH